MPTQRSRKHTVQRLRRKLRELHPRHELVRFVHRLKDLLHAVFVHSSTDQTSAAASGSATPQPATATATATAPAEPSTRLALRHHLNRSSTPLPPPRQTPPGYQSIRCVTPSEHEEGLHDDPPPGVPYHPYRPFRSYEDFRAAEELHNYNLREQQAIQELREARRRASTGLSYERLVPNHW